jgi:hypothetical protein
MNTEGKRIRIDPDSELARLLEEADETPVLLEKNGEVYRLVKEENLPRKKSTLSDEDYKAFLSSAGSWADVDIDTFLKDIYESRERSSRPPVEL